MKKNVIITIIIMALFTIVLNYSNYLMYSKSVNDFVNNVLEEIKTNHPEINDEEIIKIINDQKSYELNSLKNYGFSESDTAYLKGMRIDYKNSVYLSISLILIFIVIVIIVNNISEYKRKKEINNIINYLKKINLGKYDLDILDNSEGLISELKNEVYTTTIMLREKTLKETQDKANLKDTLSDISHQLKTPLTSILIMLDNLLNEQMDKNTRQEFLNDIKYQIENINFLILAMLKLSRLDANVINFKKEKINVQKLIIDCLKNLDVLRDLKDISIHVKGQKSVTFVGDYKWELEAITNILKNALEYTPEHKNIFIMYEDNSIYTKIVIHDEGPGLNSEDAKNIFKRFYKGKNSSNNNFGIGMSLAKEIIEHDNGSIKAYNDNGTKFVIKYYH